MSFFCATKAIIENSEGEILMVKEAKDFIQDTWDFPGGGFEEGESIIESAKREILEETGYSANIDNLVGLYKGDSNSSNTETIVFVFSASIDEKKTEELEDDIIDIQFVKPEEIKNLDLREQNRLEILEKYQEVEEYPLDILMDDFNLLTFE